VAAAEISGKRTCDIQQSIAGLPQLAEPVIGGASRPAGFRPWIEIGSGLS
jgi:hypothetical protein